MSEDKQVLIIQNLTEDLDDTPQSSPYNTTTVSLHLQDDYHPATPNRKPPRTLRGPWTLLSRGVRTLFNSAASPSRSTPTGVSTISVTRAGGGGGPDPEGTTETGYRKRALREVKKFWWYHWQVVVCGALVSASSASTLISFPLHLKYVTGNRESDGFSACFAVATILVLLFLLSSLGLQGAYWVLSVGGVTGGDGARGQVGSGASKHQRRRRSRPPEDALGLEYVNILKPVIAWKNIGKIGFSVGLSVLSLCSAWEDNKVLCNHQDPFLGLVVLFAVITHAVSRWRHVGFKRAVAMLSIAVGVFVSVDYQLIDENRCRGHYYSEPLEDIWSWKVHLVWTLAFTVAIWLWTVAMFCLESAVPMPALKATLSDDTAEQSVKLQVLSVSKPDLPQSGTTPPEAQTSLQTVISASTALPAPPGGAQRRSAAELYFRSPYSRVSYPIVFNAVFWFHLSAWALIGMFFWTEFIPGFGISEGDSAQDFPAVLMASFYECFHDGWSWLLIISLFVFAQSFTFLVLLIRNSLLAICIASTAFPFIGVWWSMFQVNADVFVWMPVYTGELICALLGFPFILAGIVYLFKLDVLNRIPVSN